MKKIGFILVLFVVFVLNSCNVDHCDVYCNSGPLSLNFALLDKSTNENLFANGTFNPDDIEILDLENDNTPVQFVFNPENDLNLITLGPFGWETKTANYKLKVDSLNIFTLNLKTEEIKTECCTTVKINKLEIKNAEFQQNPETGVYEILIAR